MNFDWEIELRKAVARAKDEERAATVREIAEAAANSDLAADDPIGDTGDSLLNLVWTTEADRWESALWSLIGGKP
jgi:hypothetical protein